MKSKYGTAGSKSAGTMGKAPKSKMFTEVPAGTYNKGAGSKYSGNMKSCGHSFAIKSYSKQGFPS